MTCHPRLVSPASSESWRPAWLRCRHPPADGWRRRATYPHSPQTRPPQIRNRTAAGNRQTRSTSGPESVAIRPPGGRWSRARDFPRLVAVRRVTMRPEPTPPGSSPAWVRSRPAAAAARHPSAPGQHQATSLPSSTAPPPHAGDFRCPLMDWMARREERVPVQFDHLNVGRTEPLDLGYSWDCVPG